MAAIKACGALALAACGLAQTGAHFEAVSVQASTLDVRGLRQSAGGGPGTSDTGHVRLYGIAARSLLMLAFDMQSNQVPDVKIEGPRSFDIEATLAGGATKEQYREMLRNLLVERFGLKYHIETQNVDGYELRAGKVKMRPAEPLSEAYEHAPGRGVLRRLDAHGAPELEPGRKGLSRFALPSGAMRISARKQEPADLAAMCTTELRVPVVDRTGLTGAFDFNLDFVPDRRQTRYGPLAAREVTETTESSTEASLRLPDFLAAVPEQLGLKLVKKKVPFQSLVVEAPLQVIEN